MSEVKWELGPPPTDATLEWLLPVQRWRPQLQILHTHSFCLWAATAKADLEPFRADLEPLKDPLDLDLAAVAVAAVLLLLLLLVIPVTVRCFDLTGMMIVAVEGVRVGCGEGDAVGLSGRVLGG